MRGIAVLAAWLGCLLVGPAMPTAARGDGVNTVTDSVQSGHNTVDDRQGTHQVEIGKGSFAAGDGIVTVNQAPGNVNDQANQVNLVLLGPTNRPPIVGGGSNSLNSSADSHAQSTDVSRGEFIGADAFLSFSGLAAVNQITGNGSGQTNIIGVTVSAGDAVPLSEGDLMAVATRNAKDVAVTNAAIADGVRDSAFTGAQGVFAVSQSGGDLNQNTNQIGVSFHTVTLR